MKLLKSLHILKLLLPVALVILSAGLAGCGNSNEPDSAADSSEISISFRLFAGNCSATRAVDEYGTPAESYIDLENLKILIFDENKVLKQVLYDNGKKAQNTSLSQISRDYYLVTTKLDPALYSENEKFAIVALANWRSGDADTKFITDWNGHSIDDSEIGKLSIDDLKGMTLTLNPEVSAGNQPESWMPGSSSSWIPMFGSRFTSITGYSNTLFGEANPMPLPDVILVRAISKIEVRNLDISENSPTIESITLINRNQVGSLMQDYLFTGFTGNVAAPTYWKTPEPATKPVPFHQKDNLYTVYLPEMNLGDAGARRAICINLDMNGVKHQKYIYLAPYSANGLPLLDQPTYNSDWDSLKRNYIYRYNINSLAFEFIIDVEPWKFGGKVHINLE